MSTKFSSIEEAIRAMADGGFVVVVDDETRENEGDLIMGAEKATADKIAFMIRHTSGIICAPLTDERLRTLDLPQMVQHNTESHATAFTVSVDFKYETSTGISAADRARTLQALAGHNARADDFARPGHIFPLRAREGGVLVRAGHTEAAVDLARLAGLQPAGVICELVNDDGGMKRLPELAVFAAEHGLPIVSITALIRHRRQQEKLIQRQQSRMLQTRYGEFQAYTYLSIPDGLRHLVLVKGDVTDGSAVLVRVHNEHPLEDLLGPREDSLLDAALRRIAGEDRGVVIYLRDPTSLDLSLFERPADAVLPDTPERAREWRENGVGSQILVDLGVRRMRLMSNSHWHYMGLESYGLEIAEHIPLTVGQLE